MINDCSLIEYLGPDEGHRCGYCKSPDTNLSYGMWGHRVMCKDYQDLIDRGWRRSGKYIYKPRLDVQCCPMYTIKCHVADFKLNKSHKKIIKTFNKFINFGILPKTSNKTKDNNLDDGERGVICRHDDEEEVNVVGNHGDMVDVVHGNNSNNNNDVEARNDDGDRAADDGAHKVRNDDEEEKKMMTKKHPKPGIGADGTKPKCKKAKLMRMEKKMMKSMLGSSSMTKEDPDQQHQQQPPQQQQQQQQHQQQPQQQQQQQQHQPPQQQQQQQHQQPPPQQPQQQQHQQPPPQQPQQQQHQQQHKQNKETNKDAPCKTLEDFLGEILPNPVHKFEIKNVAATEDNVENIIATSHSVYLKYQTGIHKDPPSKPTTKQFTRFLIDSPLTSTTTPTTSTTSTIPSATTTSTKTSIPAMTSTTSSKNPSSITDHHYQTTHSSPSTTTTTTTADKVPQGSFHQQYWLDGELIGVGVVDILSSCLSSVYFFYDPKYAMLSLGTYAALREIAYTRQLSRHDNNISSYYMGFYIHSCPKMRYKGQYSPSFLLCPETYLWQPIEKCLPLIEKNPHSRLADSDIASRGNEDGPVNISDVGILHKHMLMTYKHYKAIKARRRRNNDDDDDDDEEEEEESLKVYVRLVGMNLSRNMYVYRK